LKNKDDNAANESQKLSIFLLLAGSVTMLLIQVNQHTQVEAAVRAQ
jgi:chorismate-pyruvate lyase